MTVAKKMRCINKLKPSGTPKFMGYSGGGAPNKTLSTFRKKEYKQ